MILKQLVKIMEVIKMNEIIKQELKQNCIIQTLDNGLRKIIPYLVDNNGKEYAELFPNKLAKEDTK